MFFRQNISHIEKKYRVRLFVLNWSPEPYDGFDVTIDICDTDEYKILFISTDKKLFIQKTSWTLGCSTFFTLYVWLPGNSFENERRRSIRIKWISRATIRSKTGKFSGKKQVIRVGRMMEMSFLNELQKQLKTQFKNTRGIWRHTCINWG